MSEPTEMNRLLGVKEVADWLQVSQAWVRSHANGNRRPNMPSVKIGGVLRFRREAIQAFIDKYTREAA